MDCLFCKVLNGEIPSYKVYEDEYVYAFLDIFPNSLGHTLVIPKTHNEDFLDFDYDPNYFLSLQKVAKLLKEKLNYDGVNIANNTGKIASQEVFHMHFHIIPRYIDNNIDAKDFDYVMNKLK